jgi:hypothetical protein
VGNAIPSKRAHEVASIYLSSLMKPRDAKKEDDEEAEEKEKKEQPSVTLTAEQLQAYAGDYSSAELGVTYRLGIADGSMKLLAVLDSSAFPRFNNLSPNELRSVGKDKFKAGGGAVTIQFHRDAKDIPSGFTLDAGRTTGMVFTRTTATTK